MSSNENSQYLLGDIAMYSKNKIATKDIGVENYISTENMLPEKCGITISSGLPSSNNVSQYEKGDILVSNIRPYFKKIWHAKDVGGASNDVLVFKVNQNIADNKYVYYALSQDFFFDFMMQTAKGTKMPRGDKSAILNFPVMLPPLEEQKAIVNILSDLDEKIEVNNQISQRLEEMAQALFKYWFVDFEFPNEEGEPYKSSGGEMIESELGMIPKGWEVLPLDEIADVIYGAPFSSKLFNEEKRGLPLIRIRDLKSGNPNFYTDEERKNSTIIYPGDLLIGMDAEFTPTIWKGRKAYLNQRVCLLRANKPYIHTKYICELIKPYMRFLEFSKVGTTVIHLSKKDMDNIKVIQPPQWILEKYYISVAKMFEMGVEISKENNILRQTRDTLLPKLMSGELRVTDIQD